MVIEDAEQLSARPVTRVILRDPHRSDADFIALAEQLGLHGVTYFVGWSAWLDIAPEGVNKASALAEVAAELGVGAADVLAFGDGRNDIEMLRWAGRGVAMGQAPTEVRAAADDVTGPVRRRRPGRRAAPLVLSTRRAISAGTAQPEVSSRCCSSWWAASSTALCRHSEAR